jgi:3-hydroxy-3-methylglutaryl CoA synthase/uncharacterized OB-fold protein
MSEHARGLLGWGVHVPAWRLDRTTVAGVAGTGGGKGTRSVASYDEDAATMAVAAGRAVRTVGGPAPTDVRSLWFATTAPPYLDRTNAGTVHAALRLDRTVPAYDALGSVRSALGALHAGLHGPGPALVVASDLRTGRPGSAEEAAGGDAAVALVAGTDADGPLVAELVGHASVSEEFVDRWRVPGEPTSRLWEERFGETRYVPLAVEAFEAACKDAGVTADQVDRLVVVGLHDRAAGAAAKAMGRSNDDVVATLAAAVGNPGAAQPALALVAALEQASPGQTVALVALADGAEAFVWRTTEALTELRPALPVADQLAGAALPYGKFLAWRGFLAVEPPRRPEPARPSSSAAARSGDWKYGFVGSERDDGSIHLPPSALDQGPRPMADAVGTVVTFTVDRLAYSPNPPVLFAVVDFDDGGRLPVELTDAEAGELAIGDRVEMTFRRLFTADGIHNYFWKARPLRGGTPSGAHDEGDD